MTFEDLKAGRTAKGLNQTQAAARLGVSQPYLAMLENGARRLTPRLARLICHRHGASFSQRSICSSRRSSSFTVTAASWRPCTTVCHAPADLDYLAIAPGNAQGLIENWVAKRRC
jgi:DNA-binding XRE family transcriptional regulator